MMKMMIDDDDNNDDDNDDDDEEEEEEDDDLTITRSMYHHISGFLKVFNILGHVAILKKKGYDGPGIAHLSLLTRHNQFAKSCQIHVL